jgi:hypothetical protein
VWGTDVPTPSSGSDLVASPQLLGVLLLRAVPWAVAAGVVTVLVLAVADGLAAAGAGVLGLLLVVGFFGLDLLVMRWTRRSAPRVTAGLLLAGYVVKVLLLAAAVWLLANRTELDMQGVAWAVVVTTVAFVVGITVAALRTRSFSLDP